MIVGVRDWGGHEAGVAGLLAAAVAQLDVSLLEVAQLGGRDGRRGAGWDPRLEALEVCQLEQGKIHTVNLKSKHTFKSAEEDNKFMDQLGEGRRHAVTRLPLKTAKTYT